jgi:hypothetical protein
MAILTSAGITFGDSTTQSTAATATSTALDGIGTYSILIMAADNNLAIGSTIAGSSLRYNYTSNGPGSQTGVSSTTQSRSVQGGTYDGGGTSLSGTWRRMNSGTIFTTTFDPDSQITTRTYNTGLYVRIS